MLKKRGRVIKKVTECLLCHYELEDVYYFLIHYLFLNYLRYNIIRIKQNEEDGN